MNNLRFIDLFAGIGGFHVALRDKGLECVFASEIDRLAAEAYQRNFGLKPMGDITQISTTTIPPHDVLCAGFPCQPFSRSGKGKGLADARGRLFYEIVRVIKHHQPMLVLLENVKTILTIDNGSVERAIYQSLEADLGYRLHRVILNSGDFGIPQQRERVYFVGIRGDSYWHFTPPQGNGAINTLNDILLPDDETGGLVIERNDIVYDKDKIQPPSNRPLRIGYLNKGGQGERIYSPNGHAITLSANGGGVGHRTGLYYVNDRVRRLHIDEAKQVMGFARGHIVSAGISGYRQLGNAIVPPMVGHIYDGVGVA